MKRATKFFLLGGCAAVLAAGVAIKTVSAHDRGHGARGGHHGSMMDKGRGMGPRAVLRYLDANQDFEVSRDEADEVVASKLAAFDANGDASLSLEEFEGLWLEFTRPRRVDAFQFLDDDGDGQVTRAELDRPIARLFQRADRNEDGVINRDDRRRGRGGRGGRRGGGQPQE